MTPQQIFENMAKEHINVHNGAFTQCFDNWKHLLNLLEDENVSDEFREVFDFLIRDIFEMKSAHEKIWSRRKDFVDKVLAEERETHLVK